MNYFFCQEDKFGKTPLYYAQQNGWHDVASLMIIKQQLTLHRPPSSFLELSCPQIDMAIDNWIRKNPHINIHRREIDKLCKLYWYMMMPLLVVTMGIDDTKRGIILRGFTTSAIQYLGFSRYYAACLMTRSGSNQLIWRSNDDHEVDELVKLLRHQSGDCDELQIATSLGNQFVPLSVESDSFYNICRQNKLTINQNDNTISLVKQIIDPILEKSSAEIFNAFHAQCVDHRYRNTPFSLTNISPQLVNEVAQYNQAIASKVPNVDYFKVADATVAANRLEYFNYYPCLYELLDTYNGDISLPPELQPLVDAGKMQTQHVAKWLEDYFKISAKILSRLPRKIECGYDTEFIVTLLKLNYFRIENLPEKGSSEEEIKAFHTVFKYCLDLTRVLVPDIDLDSQLFYPEFLKNLLK